MDKAESFVRGLSDARQGDYVFMENSSPVGVQFVPTAETVESR